MQLCWYQDPAERPTFAAINGLIDKHLETVAGYVETACLFPEIRQYRLSLMPTANAPGGNNNYLDLQQ